MRATSLLISGSSSTTSSIGSSGPAIALSSTFPVRSSVEHRVDARRHCRRAPVAIADDVVANRSILVDEERLGKLVGAPALRYLARRIEQHVERRALGEELADRRPVVVDADGEQAEVLAALLLHQP